MEGDVMPRCHARAVAALLTVVLPSCVPSDQVTIAFDSARFNEKIRGDFRPLTADDLAVDNRFGLFRDSGDGGLVSEVFPQSPTADSVSGRLVRTPCLF